MSTVLNVPAPRPDETLGSVALRINDRNGASQSEKACMRLFGNRQIKIDRILARGIAHFCEATGNLGYGSLGAVQARHSLLPILRPVVDETFYRLAEARIAEGRIAGLHKIIWDSGCGPVRHRRHFCRPCARGQLAELGFTFWRRSTQIRGAMLCATCHGVLTEACDSCDTGGLPNPECPKCNDLRPTGESLASLRYAQVAAQAFDGSIPYAPPKARLAAVLTRLGEATDVRPGIDAANRLAEMAHGTFGRDLADFGLHLDRPPHDGWPLIYLVGAGYREDIVVHLVVLSLLFQSADDYAAALQEVRTSKPCPWLPRLEFRFGFRGGLRSVHELHRMGWNAEDLARSYHTDPDTAAELLRVRPFGHRLVPLAGKGARKRCAPRAGAEPRYKVYFKA